MAASVDKEKVEDIVSLLVESGPKIVTKTKTSTKIYEEVITYQQYLEELKEKGENNIDIEELDSDYDRN